MGGRGGCDGNSLNGLQTRKEGLPHSSPASHHPWLMPRSHGLSSPTVLQDDFRMSTWADSHLSFFSYSAFPGVMTSSTLNGFFRKSLVTYESVISGWTKKALRTSSQSARLNASRMITFVLRFKYKGDLSQRVEATPGHPPQTATSTFPFLSFPESELRADLREVFALILTYSKLPRDGLQSHYPPFLRFRKYKLALCLKAWEASHVALILQTLQRTGTGDSGHSVQFRVINQETV